MKRKRFTQEQIVKTLNEAESGIKVSDLIRRLGICEQTFYRWRSKYGGLQVNEAKRLKELEDENHRLKKLLAETLLDKEMLKDVLSKKW
ncbi:MAG TPA: transposase [Verrucomicrobiales bacterium]|jgi:putative transposase|nr:transposase [Verrucomicrobiales bacterium]HIL71038.1 transposase [Verrucomicrobiota bacterium]